MARLPKSLLRQAKSLDPLLPLLLRSCRDLESSQNELRWLREHALGDRQASKSHSGGRWKAQLRRMCLQRSNGKPLQYILGSQPFGGLDILCRKGVLIPRPETESMTQHLSSLLDSFRGPDSLRILDLCTGTGCISLLLHALLAQYIPKLDILGIDISSEAISLARQNILHNVIHGNLSPRVKREVNFAEEDIFDFASAAHVDETWDVLISNPPYISPDGFNRTTSRSVRNYEPRNALVPTIQPLKLSDTAIGDAFYPLLIRIAEQTGVKVLLVEVADLAQAGRVARMVLEGPRWATCEIWKDWPAGASSENNFLEIYGKPVYMRGSGNGRAVLAWTLEGKKLVGRK